EGVEGVREARFSMLNGSPELDLVYDRERMRVLGVAPATVASTVAAYYQGISATVYREGGDEHVVRVRAPAEARASLEDLRYVPIALPTGGTVPLGSIATIGDRLGPIDIEREDQRRVAKVEVTRLEGTDLGTVTRRVEARIAALGVPDGMHVEIGG